MINRARLLELIQQSREAEGEVCHIYFYDVSIGGSVIDKVEVNLDDLEGLLTAKGEDR